MGRKPKESGDGAETREKILSTAIELFAEKGFGAVSIREIAAAVGIKGASIYNHFEGKDDILEAILARHIQLSGEVFTEDVPESLEKSLESSLLRGLSLMGAPGMDKIFRILSREQLNNERIRSFFLKEYIESPRVYLAKRFADLIADGTLAPADPDQLANEFHAFVMYKYYENYLLREDKNMDFEKMAVEFGEHISFFCKAVRKAAKRHA